MGQFPVIGEELGQPGRIGGGTGGVVVGLIGCLYGGLGVAQAVQNAMNSAWSVPRNSRPNPFKARGISLLLLVTVGVGVIATTALSAGLTNGVAGDALSRGNLQVLVFAATTALNVVIFAVAFRLATALRLRPGDVLPGAVLAALVYLGLQVFGASYVGWVIDRSSATSGVFAIVLGLIAFVYATAVAVVLCVEVNVVRGRRLWPRALLTPFTDSVDLTPGDRRAYTAQAKAQRLKGFEEVDVTFGPGRTRATRTSRRPRADTRHVGTGQRRERGMRLRASRRRGARPVLPRCYVGGAWSDARKRWTSDTAIAPSPTAEATRLTEPWRMSPAANTPGALVSRNIGSRSSAQPSRPPSCRRSGPATM
jgi:hypothetical protein